MRCEKRGGRRAGWTLAALALAGAPALAEDAGPAMGQSAHELLDRAFHNLYADDFVQVMNLTTRSRGGRSMSRKLQITRKQSGDPGKALVRFLEPYEVRRTSILILENEGATDDLYVYLPASRMTRHLSASQRADSFFGTDLSYEDVEPKNARDYRARFVGVGDLDGAPCTRVEFEAGPNFVSTYERMVSCIEVERGVSYWTDFYQNGAVVKRLEVDPASVRAIGTRFIPFEMKLRTLRRDSETRVVTDRYEISPEIPDHIFTTWNLEAGDADRDRHHAGVERENASDSDDLPAVSADAP